MQQFGVRSDIAGGENAQGLFRSTAVNALDLDRGRAKQMPGIPVARANAGNDIDPLFVIDRRKRLQGGDRIGLRIDRGDLAASARGIAPVQRLDFRFLNAAGVGQHVGAQIDSAARRQDAAGKSAAHELWQQAAMIDMGMGQQHGVDIGGTKRKGAVVQFLQRLLSLKQTAIDQETPSAHLKEVAGARDGARCAAKPDGDAH